MNLRIPGMNGSSSDGNQPLSGSGGLDLSSDLNSPDGSGLLSELSGGENIPSAMGAQKRSSASIVLLVVVVAVAGGALYAMRHIGMTGLPDFEDNVTITYPLDRAGKKFHEDYQTLLANLRSSDQVVQVPLTDVVMNPFTWKGEDDRVAAAPIDRGPADREREITRVTDQRNREVTFTLGRLKFTGVMGRRARTATVNGALVREGDTVADYFRVAEIRDREIDLIALPFQHTLGTGEVVTITPNPGPHTLSLDGTSPSR